MFAAAYVPPGLMAGLVEQKAREVAQMKKLPEARGDGPWALRLAYPASQGSYVLARAIGWRRERMSVLVDLKRRSPGNRIGSTEQIDDSMQVVPALKRLQQLDLTAAIVCTDLDSWGGTWGDLRDARDCVNSLAPLGASPMPIVAKDLIIDPIQIARAVCEGAHAVVIIAAACLGDLRSLLDTCTLLAVEVCLGPQHPSRAGAPRSHPCSHPVSRSFTSLRPGARGGAHARGTHCCH